MNEVTVADSTVTVTVGSTTTTVTLPNSDVTVTVTEGISNIADAVDTTFTSLADNDFVVWDAGTDRFINATFTALDIASAATLDALSTAYSGHASASNPHSGSASTTDLTNHTSNTSNPHSVTAAQSGAWSLAGGDIVTGTQTDFSQPTYVFGLPIGGEFHLKLTGFEAFGGLEFDILNSQLSAGSSTLRLLAGDSGGLHIGEGMIHTPNKVGEVNIGGPNAGWGDLYLFTNKKIFIGNGADQRTVFESDSLLGDITLFLGDNNATTEIRGDVLLRGNNSKAKHDINSVYYHGTLTSHIMHQQADDKSNGLNENDLFITGYMTEGKNWVERNELQVHSLTGGLISSPVVSPINGVETVILFDPQTGYLDNADGLGTAVTLDLVRGYEADMGIFSGTINNMYGYDCRLRNSRGSVPTTATIGQFTSYYAHGLDNQGFNGYITDYTGFHAAAGSVDDPIVDGDWIGLRVDLPSVLNFTAGNTYGIWFTSDTESKGGDIVFGSNKLGEINFSTEISASQAMKFSAQRDGLPNAQSQGMMFVSSTANFGANVNAYRGHTFRFVYDAAGAATGEVVGSRFTTRTLTTSAMSDLTLATTEFTQSAANTITNLRQYHLKNFVKHATGVITNQYGLQIDKQDQGANNYGMWLNGDDLGADITFGAGKDVRMHFNGTGLEFEGTGIAWTTNADAAVNGYVTVYIDGVARKLATIA